MTRGCNNIRNITHAGNIEKTFPTPDFGGFVMGAALFAAMTLGAVTSAEARIVCFPDHPVTYVHEGITDIPWEQMKDGARNNWTRKVWDELGGEWADWPWDKARDRSMECGDTDSGTRKCVLTAIPCRVN